MKVRFTRALVAALCTLAVTATLGALAAPARAADRAPAQQRVVLAGGCFWGMQAVFERLKGVSKAVAGYSGGNAVTAHYEIVSTGTTGHAESVEITYDPSKISFGDLLKVYFLVAHDPTELNRQGPDDGTQYRSAIFYTTPDQKAEAQRYIDELTKQKVYDAPIVTQLVPFHAFYPAEAYHQDFLNHNPDNPYIVINDMPKLAALKQRFPNLVKAG